MAEVLDFGEPPFLDYQLVCPVCEQEHLDVWMSGTLVCPECGEEFNFYEA